MQPAQQEFVLGDFSNVTFSFGRRTSRFFARDGKYFIETLDAEGKQTTFQVRYTFGYEPLQQYLLQTGGGRLQAFDVAWDSRPASQGGQRWFQLQDENVTDPEHPFFWSGYYQNWNSRCAACHTTDFNKHYDSQTNQFQSTWSDINVACESCHGPGKAHTEHIRNHTFSPAHTGLQELGKQLTFHLVDGDPIARAAETMQQPSLALETCGACHSRRADLQAAVSSAPFHQQFQLEGITEPNYFSDGQIQDEVFVLGSFLQSKMAEAGVTCTNCHDPHTGQTKLPGAQICNTCHAPAVFAQPQHTNGHAQANCLDCHMPQRVYMGVDARRDHRFHRPGIKHPNSSAPCKVCHVDESDDWLHQALTAWPKRDGASADTLGDWAALNQRLAEFDSTAINDALTFLNRNALPSLEKAALIEKMVVIAPERTTDSITSLASNQDPVARQSAARAAAGLPLTLSYPILLKLSQDPVKSVRAVVAGTILTVAPEWFIKAPPLTALLEEYQQVLRGTQDNPGANLGLAHIAQFQQDIPAAINAYEQALRIDPQYIPGLLSYADFLRRLGNEDQARHQLELALRYGKELGAVQFAYGLLKIREQAYAAALPFLAKAASTKDALPRYAFVYAVALWQQQSRQQAVEVLASAATRWPGDYDLLQTWAKYAYQLRDVTSLQQAVKAFGQHYPDDKTYRQLKKIVK
ncbi:hypothetical protein GCM10011338_43710 [Alteromonas lipolytica]|nr:hypothetical protein GCM10011338_43710 [Alteromonas lipolytica]